MGDDGAVENDEMTWLNEPRDWSREGDTITVRADPGTDFWRTTHYGFVRDNGHCFARRWEGDFVASVVADGDYRDRYDQAGLMVRLDETTWLKCGVEYVDGVHLASVVVTREVSDWSVMPLPAEPGPLRLRVTRRGAAVEVHCATGTAEMTMIRLAYFTDEPRVLVGPMVAAPDGAGFSARFTGFTIGAA
ncbi:MAG: DUF1349 domain-containing protein [Thermomicrobiales bacterium]